MLSPDVHPMVEISIEDNMNYQDMVGNDARNDHNPEEPCNLQSTSWEQEADSDKLFLLQCMCERNSLLRGDELDRQLKSIESGVLSTGSLSGFYTSKPFSTMLVRRPAKFFIGILILYLLIFIWQIAFRIDTDFGDMVDKYVSLRLIPQGGSEDALQSVDRFAPTFNGFELTGEKSYLQGDRLIVEFANSHLVNGFFFTYAANVSRDLQFGIQVSRSSDGERWEPIYSNTCWRGHDKLPTTLPAGLIVDAYETWSPPARKWCYILALAWLLAGWLAAGIGCLWMLYRRRVEVAKHLFVFGVFATFKCWLLISIVPWKAECLHSLLSIFYMITNTGWFLLSVRFAMALWYEKSMTSSLSAFGICGALHCVAQLLDPISENATRVASFSALIIMNVSFAMVPAFSWLFMRRRQRAAQLLVADDMDKYRKIWAEMSGEESLPLLKEVAASVQRMAVSGGAAQHLSRQGLTHLRQGSSFSLNSGGQSGTSMGCLGFCFGGAGAAIRRTPSLTKNQAASWHCRHDNLRWEKALDNLSPTYPDGIGRGVAGTRDARAPVQSLDQLYLQACALHPVLKSLVRRWAATCGGCLHASQNNTRVSDGSDVLSDENLQLIVPTSEIPDHQLRWAKLKSTSRAIEKAVRSYKGDVSLVVDICRQSMVFHSLADLVACLQLIEKDPSIRVLRVKNRLDLDYDDTETAGYRDVALNLLVLNEETVRMGIENHVCELQLIPGQIFRLKTAQGHARYVSFRNMRAE